MRSSVEGTLGNSGGYVEIASYQPSPTFPPPAHLPLLERTQHCRTMKIP